jgi:hypothetical protein
MVANIFSSGTMSGLTNRFVDIAIDAQYQFMGTIEPEDLKDLSKMESRQKAVASRYIITAHAVWIHEKQDWKASFPLENASNPSDFLNTFRLKP